MTTIKQATRHRRRQMALFLTVCISGSVLMFSMFFWVASIGTIFFLYSLICIAMLTILVKVSGKWDAAFRCPDCGGCVDDALDTQGKASEPILRLCPACNILWQTGLTASD